MSSIYLTGLSSGLDTDAIVSALVAAEGTGRTRITMEQAAVNARKTNLTDVQSKLNALRYAVADLRSAGVWADTQAVESADGTKVAASRVAGTGPGAYEVQVTQLAAAERRSYAYAPPVGASALTILNQDGSTRASVALADGATIDDAVAAINADPDAKLFAVNVDGSLVLAARDTGAASEFSVTGAGAQTSRSAGMDAAGTVDGTPFTSSSNTVTNAIAGLSLTLKGKTDATVVTVGGPTPDLGVVKGKVQAFVDRYNDLVTTIRADISEKRVPTATTATDAAKGSLFGDQGLNALLSSLRQTVGSVISGLGAGADELADLGISTGAPGAGTSSTSDAVQGKLTFDAATFAEALTKDPRAVQRLLGGEAGTDGIAQALEGVITPYAQVDGVLSQRLKAADGDITRVGDKLQRFDDRLADREAYYKKIYAALEVALQNSKSIASDLASRLGTTIES